MCGVLHHLYEISFEAGSYLCPPCTNKVPSYRHCVSLIDIIARVKDSTRKLSEVEAKVLHG